MSVVIVRFLAQDIYYPCVRGEYNHVYGHEMNTNTHWSGEFGNCALPIMTPTSWPIEWLLSFVLFV